MIFYCMRSSKDQWSIIEIPFAMHSAHLWRFSSNLSKAVAMQNRGSGRVD